MAGYLDGSFHFVSGVPPLDAAFAGTYQPHLVVLSLLVAILAAAVALSTADRVANATSFRGRIAWVAAGGVSMGGGIWAMHFIAMLAFSLPCGISYDLPITAVSVVPGILASAVALWFIGARSQFDGRRQFLGALLMGAGIGTMHYSGMAAMRMGAFLRYDIAMVAVSVGVAVALAFLSLSLRFLLRGRRRRLAVTVSAIAMGCAVAGMHYTAMAAAIFFPGPSQATLAMALPLAPLATLVTVFTVFLAVTTLAATFAGRQLETARHLEEGIRELARAEREMVAARRQAEIANRAKTDFLANMSHELRTPLNAIIGFSDVMRAHVFGPLNNPHYEEYAANIHEAGTHLLHVINDILDVSKIEAGKFELQEEPVDMAEVVASCLSLIRERAQDAKVTLRTSVPEALPGFWADPRRMKQILINLLSNAVKFTPAGGLVEVAVSVAPGGEMTIGVRDTGVGIAPEDMEKVLAPFGQAESLLSRKFEGTGLGLPLTQGLVELHGGIMELTSTPGKGTLVSLHFPAERTRFPRLRA